MSHKKQNVENNHEEEDLHNEDTEITESSYNSSDDDNYTITAALQEQFKATPWYMGSIAVHLLLFLLLMLIPVEPRPTKTKKHKMIITSDDEDDTEFNLDEIPETDEEIVETTDLDNVTTDINTPNVEIPVSIDVSMDIDVKDESSPPEEMALETISPIKPKFMGVIGKGLSMGSRSLGNITGRVNTKAKLDAVMRGGGDKRTIDAALAGLKWLAAHQEPNGSWDPRKFGGHRALTAGVTSVALLAFVGEGNTPDGGKFRSQTAKAVKWLISHQEDSGLIGLHSEAGIALMALAETYDMCGSKSLKKKLRKVCNKLIDYCKDNQFRCGGWDYYPEPWQTSQLITGWYVLGLKSARIARLKVPDSVYERAKIYFEYATSNSGDTFSSMRIDKNTLPQELAPQWRVIGAMALTCLQFLGVSRDHTKVKACAERAITRLPNKWAANEIDYSYIYYQGLGLFQMGVDSQYWREFNTPMKDTLIDLQVKNGLYSSYKGSWPPSGKDPMNWGRIGSTAMACLTLQIYYLYNNS